MHMLGSDSELYLTISIYGMQFLQNFTEPLILSTLEVLSEILSLQSSALSIMLP